MRVIPFNPGGAGRDRADRPQGAGARGGAGAGDGGDEVAGPAGEHARVQRLENALLDALRENAANWARAERAERLLEERTPAPPAERG